MPNRLVREGFLDSDAVNRLSDAAECFYHRLLLAADDCGRMDGRLEILRSRLYPLGCRRTYDAEKLIAECANERLVNPYIWDGKPFLQLSKVQRSSPSITSKYPWIDGSYTIEWVQIETRDGKKEFAKTSLSLWEGFDKGSVRVTNPLDPPLELSPESKTKTKTDTKTMKKRAPSARKVPLPEDFGISEDVRRWATENGHTRLDERLEHFRGYALANGKNYADWNQAFRNAISGDWAHLNGKFSAAQPKGWGGFPTNQRAD